MKKTATFLLTAFACTSLATAQMGTARLDSVFGTFGYGQIHSPQANNEYAQAGLIQSDDKIVMVGYTGVPMLNLISWGRLNADGSVDTAFAMQGFGAFDLSSAGLPSNANSTISEVVELNNGKLLMGGTIFYLNGTLPQSKSFLLRLNSNGTMDTSFDSDGIYVFDKSTPGVYPESVQSIVPLANGEALVCGNYVNDVTAVGVSYVQKITDAGAFTGATYSKNNWAFTKILSFDNGVSFIVCSDSTNSYEDRLTKITTATMLVDSTFGTDGTASIGWALTNTQPAAAIKDAAMTPNGTIMVLLHGGFSGNKNLVLAEYSTSGVANGTAVATPFDADVTFMSTNPVITKLGIDQITGDIIVTLPLPNNQTTAFLYFDSLRQRNANYFFESSYAGYANHEEMGISTCNSCTTPYGSIPVMAGFQSNGRPVVGGRSSTLDTATTVSHLDYTVFRYNVLGAFCVGLSATASGNNATCPTCADGTATVSTTSTVAPLAYLWSNGQVTATATGLLPNNYMVTVTDGNGCQFTATTSVGFAVGVSRIDSDLSVAVYPNPAQGLFMADIPASFGQEVNISVFNVLGELVHYTSAAAGLQEINLSHLPAGNYALRFSNAEQAASQKISIVK